MPMIFVSYSHLDRKWFDPDHPPNLIPWLENALRRDGVTLWYDRGDEAGLQPGDRFEQEITQAIDRADIALFLISEAFFSSEFIRTVELPRILTRAERGEMIVIPVLLEPCDWQSFDFVAARQMLPGAPTPLIDYTETERQWAHARDEILSGIRRRIRGVGIPAPPRVPPSPQPRPSVALPRWAWVALFLALAVLSGRAWIWPQVRRLAKPIPTPSTAVEPTSMPVSVVTQPLTTSPMPSATLMPARTSTTRSVESLPTAQAVTTPACPLAAGELVNAAGRWQVFTQGTGLSDLAVGDGAVWAATAGGLVCWDVAGRTSERYTTLDGLESNSLSAVEIGPDGTLWVGTGVGLARWDGDEWIPVQEIRGVVTDLAFAPGGSLWAAVSASPRLRVQMPDSGYVARYDGAVWTIYDRQHGLADNPGPWALAIESNGEVWAAQTNSVSEWDGQAWHIHDFRTQAVQAIAVGPGDTIWAGSDKAVSTFDGHKWVTYTVESGLMDNDVYAIALHPDGTLWMGTDGGVRQWDGRTWTSHTTVGLGSDSVTAIAIDTDGSIWVGGWGLSHYREGVWTADYRSETGIRSHSVRAIEVEKDASLWVGTLPGLRYWDGSTWSVPTGWSDGLFGLSVYGVIAMDRVHSGDLWAAKTFGVADLYIGAGVDRWNGERWTTYKVEDGLANDEVHAIAVGTDGVEWFGTMEGLSVHDGGTWRTYTTADGLGGNDVRALAMQPDGILWVGTNGGGVSRWDGDSWSTYTAKDGLPENTITALAVGNDAAIWCGTSSRGIGRWDGLRWTTYTVQDGLGDDHVTSVAVSPDGDVWVGTELGGVSRWDGTAWTAFTREDGLSEDYVEVVAVTPEGTIWIGTHSEGVMRFVPAE